jgi:hypothetical protein
MTKWWFITPTSIQTLTEADAVYGQCLQELHGLLQKCGAAAALALVHVAALAVGPAAADRILEKLLPA